MDTKEFKKVALPPSVKGVKSVAAGWGHTAAVTSDDLVLVFGRPYDFANLMQINKLNAVNKNLGRFVGRFTNWFGDSSSDEGLYTMPQIVANLEKVQTVHCSAGLTLAQTKNGDLFSFGLNRWGQCGVSQKDVAEGKNTAGIHVFDPVKVNLSGRVKMVDTGLQHCVALLESGEVWTWGKGNRGQLGDGEMESGSTPVRVRFPTSLLSPSGSSASERGAKRSREEFKIKQIAAGFNHSVALSEEGHVFIWGKGMSLALKDQQQRAGSGVGDAEARQALIQGGRQKVAVYEDQPTPRLVTLPPSPHAAASARWEEVCCSNFTVVLRDSQGGLWAMGIGEYDRNSVVDPIRVQKAIEGELADDATQSDPASAADSVVHLRKGYQRVGVLDATPATSDRGHPGLCEYKSSERAFEVVVHQGEAFLQTIQGLEGADEPARDKGLVDYATGWQHHVAIFEE
jgi:alpha-tubulin suppressor-like RCC1 family protein